MFEKYEGFNLNNYVDGQTNKMVFGNEEINDSNIKDQILKLSDNLKNQFFQSKSTRSIENNSLKMTCLEMSLVTMMTHNPFIFKIKITIISFNRKFIIQSEIE